MPNEPTPTEMARIAEAEAHQSSIHRARAMARVHVWERSGPTLLKATALGGASIAVGVAASDILKNYYDGKRQPLSDQVAVTGDGTYVRSPDGGLTFTPSLDYLDAIKKGGYTLEGIDGTPGTLPVFVDKPQSPEQTANQKGLETLTKPSTLITVGLVIVAVIAARRLI